MLPSYPSDHEQREHGLASTLRDRVLARDNYQCVACGIAGENRLQLHHLEFRSQGGADEYYNLVTLCFKCHHLLHAGFLDVELVEWKRGFWSVFCKRSRSSTFS